MLPATNRCSCSLAASTTTRSEDPQPDCRVDLAVQSADNCPEDFNPAAKPKSSFVTPAAAINISAKTRVLPPGLPIITRFPAKPTTEFMPASLLTRAAEPPNNPYYHPGSRQRNRSALGHKPIYLNETIFGHSTSSALDLKTISGCQTAQSRATMPN